MISLNAIVAMLMTIESGNDPKAIGDNGDAVGVLQIHKIMVDEVNRIVALKTGNRDQRYTHADRRDPDKSSEMCVIFLMYQIQLVKKRHPDEPLGNWQLMQSWNSGSVWKPSTESYAKKVLAALDNHKHGITIK